MKTTLTDAELDYCNAEGIAPADFIKRKFAAMKKKKKPSKQASESDAFKPESSGATIVGKKITATRINDGRFKLSNGTVIDDELWKTISTRTRADSLALSVLFSEWSKQINKALA